MTSPAPRPTVASISDAWSNFLVAVPSVGYEVCEVCHGRVPSTFAVCFGCKVARDILGRDGCADAVSAVSLAARGGQVARTLTYYKRNGVDVAEQSRMRVGLAASLWRWLSEHKTCLSRAAGSGGKGFDMITTVPSTKGRSGMHPLVEVVTGIVEGSAVRYEHLLEPGDATVPPHTPALHRFAAVRSLHHESILIVDDTWTGGANAQSASSALKAAGAGTVAILVLGRWMTPGFQDTTEWLQRQHQPWSWQTCAVGRH